MLTFIRCFLPSEYSDKMTFTFHIPYLFTSYRTLRCLVTRLLSEEHKLCRNSKFSLILISITFFLVRPHFLLSALFWDTLSVHYEMDCKDFVRVNMKNVGQLKALF